MNNNDTQSIDILNVYNKEISVDEFAELYFALIESIDDFPIIKIEEVLNEFESTNPALAAMKDDEDNDGDSDYGTTNVTPVYVILSQMSHIRSKIIRLFTRSQWSHSGIAFSSTLSRIFSFASEEDENGKKRYGFVVESRNAYLGIDPNCKCKVLSFFVKAGQKRIMKALCDKYNQRKKDTSYNLGNILGIVINHPIKKFANDPDKMICSQFVFTVLSLAGLHMKKDKDASLVTPENLNSLANDARLFQVYEGTLKGYNARKVRTLCRDLINKAKKDII